MKDRSLRVRWASKIMRSKFFVALTDEESMIALEGADPKSLRDHIALQEQMVSLQAFRDALNNLIKAHEKRVDELVGGKHVTKSSKKAQPKKGGRS